MEALGLGIIGFGKFALWSIEAFAKLPDVRVVAVAETDLLRRQEASRLGIPVLADASELINFPGVDIVHIITPPSTHAPLAIAAARAGKHILCEKPLALSIEDGVQILQAADTAGVQLMVDYVLRYNPLVIQLKALLSSGIFGRLHHLSLENWATDEMLKPGHWFWKPESSGGIWIEHGVHFFDMFHNLIGQAAESVAANSQARPDGSVDRVWALVKYTGGLTASFHHAFTQPDRIERTTIRLASTLGYMTLYGWIPMRLVVEGLVDEQGLNYLKMWSGESPVIMERYTGEQLDGWASGAPYRVLYRVRSELTVKEARMSEYFRSIRAAMADLVHAVRDPDFVPAVTREDAMSSLAVAQMATLSAQTGRWEAIPAT